MKDPNNYLQEERQSDGGNEDFISSRTDSSSTRYSKQNWDEDMVALESITRSRIGLSIVLRGGEA